MNDATSWINVVGDVMIGRSFNSLFKTSPDSMSEIWGNTLDFFNNSQSLLLGNLETTLTSSSNPWPNKAFNFALHPRYSHTLKYPHFDCLSIANNHILDFRKEGLVETIKTLDIHGISYAGAGLDDYSAKRPSLLYLPNGVGVHVFAAADHYDYWAAGNVTPVKGKEGIWWFDLSNPRDLLITLEGYMVDLPDNDIVVVSLHWGGNWEADISAEKKYLAYQLSRLGVRIVMGHSAHHIQDAEQIGETVVFYSLGDFIDDYAIRPEYNSDIGMIGSIEIGNKGEIKSAEKILTHINYLQVNILS